jgi:hypothetical protein
LGLPLNATTFISIPSLTNPDIIVNCVGYPHP